MGVSQPIGLGALLVLSQRSDMDTGANGRLSEALRSADHCLACVHGTIEEKEMLEVSNLWALILSSWNANADGLDMLAIARSRLPKLPILVVGADDDEDTRITAYETGADDFVAASCSDRELSARVKGLLRRCDHSEDFEDVEDVVCIDDLKIWVEPQVAYRSGKPIKLSKKEMQLLLYLVDNRGRAVSRIEILESVFGVAHDPGTNVVEVHIHRLRNKIDGKHSNPLLKTKRGLGYMLEDSGGTNIAEVSANIAFGSQSCASSDLSSDSR